MNRKKLQSGFISLPVVVIGTIFSVALYALIISSQPASTAGVISEAPTVTETVKIASPSNTPAPTPIEAVTPEAVKTPSPSIDIPSHETIFQYKLDSELISEQSEELLISVLNNPEATCKSIIDSQNTAMHLYYVVLDQFYVLMSKYGTYLDADSYIKEDLNTRNSHLLLTQRTCSDHGFLLSKIPQHKWDTAY